MITKLKHVDVVTVGVGLTGAIMGKELASLGLKVVGLERGQPRDTVPDFQSGHQHDELRFSVRKAFMQDNAKEAMTSRNAMDQTALPMRRWEGFLPGTGVGGSAVHWNGQTFRYEPSDFINKTYIEKKYGKKFMDSDLRNQDWGVTYDELETHYDRFEYLCGTSGTAGNVKGKIQAGGNPFEGWRSREYPNPALKEPYFASLFRKAATDLGHKPYPQPASNMSRPYTNPEGFKKSQLLNAHGNSGS